MADVVVGDWDGSSSEVYKERVLRVTRPGSVLLFHDSGQNHGEAVVAVDELIPLLQEQGYRFLTMNDLLQRGEAVSRRGFW